MSGAQGGDSQDINKLISGGNLYSVHKNITVLILLSLPDAVSHADAWQPAKRTALSRVLIE